LVSGFSLGSGVLTVLVSATLLYCYLYVILPFLLARIDLSDSEVSLLFTGGTSTRNYSDTTKRSISKTVLLDPVREAAIARAQKKGRGDVQSTLGRRTVEDTTSPNGEWACNVCTLHNPVSISCPQRTTFLPGSMSSYAIRCQNTCSIFGAFLFYYFPLLECGSLWTRFSVIKLLSMNICTGPCLPLRFELLTIMLTLLSVDDCSHLRLLVWHVGVLESTSFLSRQHKARHGLVSFVHLQI